MDGLVYYLILKTILQMVGPAYCNKEGLVQTFFWKFSRSSIGPATCKEEKREDIFLMACNLEYR